MSTATEHPRINGVPLREYVEALFAERERQAEVAAQEREKAAAALRASEARAMDQAEREREKAANAMRISLDRAIKEGDERLREHIANQISQIDAALESAEKLETQRMKGAGEATEALRREMKLITAASEQAVKKAEEAQKDVNAKSNEFRGQLSDQATTFMPRRESESRSSELDRRIEEARTERNHQIDALSARLANIEQVASGARAVSQNTERREDRSQPWQIYIVGAILTVIIVLSNFLSGHHP